MFFRRPSGIDQLAPGASIALARLAALEGMARALLVGLAPLLALEALGSKQAVSYVYLAASVFTMCVTLNINTLERLLARRWVVTLGGGFLIAAAALLFAGTGPLFALGLGMRSAAASIFSVCMSLYIMDYIGKRDLARSESRRITHLAGVWLVGPSAGLWLWHHAGQGAPFALSALAAGGMLAFFWYLRLGANPVVRAARTHPGNPLAAVRRYLRQPRLRIAYGITVSRSTFWVTLYVYGPIYVVESGLPVWAVGLLLSGCSALLFLSPVVRALAERFGTRTLIVAGLAITGASLAALGALGPARPLGLVFWATAGVGAVALDVLGNIPFMRMVRPRERTEMTMVFSTWREVSELLTPGLAAAVLLVAPFSMLYVVLAVMHFGAAMGASRLPRRL